MKLSGKLIKVEDVAMLIFKVADLVNACLVPLLEEENLVPDFYMTVKP
jgi:hypothetical protein